MLACACGCAGGEAPNLRRAAYEGVWAIEERLAALPEFQVESREVQAAMGKEAAQYLHSALDDSGTTAVMLVLGPDALIVANVGDSRAVLCWHVRLTTALTRAYLKR